MRSDEILTSAKLTLEYASTTGTCYFTNVRMVTAKGTVTTNLYATLDEPLPPVFVFDTYVQVKSLVQRCDGYLTVCDYQDSKSDIVCNSVCDQDGHTFETYYQYDSKHNLIKTEDSRGLVIEYTYSDYGKMLTKKTYQKDKPGAYMFSEYTYKDEHFLASERDQRYSRNGEALKTLYDYDTNRGLLLTQTDVDGQEYNYTYNTKDDNLISISSTTDSQTAENQFFYTYDYLTRVSHNGFHFDFAFDELGRSKSVSVGDNNVKTTLFNVDYDMSSATDVVTTTYATGEKTEVKFDLFGNPTTSIYTVNGTNTTVSDATYDDAGNLIKLVDNERGVCYNYTYDSDGNVTRVEERNAETNALIATNTFVYGNNQRVNTKTYGAVGHTYRPIYEATDYGWIYSDNEVVGVTLDGSFTDTADHDGLRRVTEKSFSVIQNGSSSSLFSESYGYLNTPLNGKTVETEMVSHATSTVHGTDANTAAWSYTYDKAGNLETVSKNGALQLKYYYDGFRRLVREDNYPAGKTFVHTYNVGGNITAQRVYALSADANLGTPEITRTYQYATGGWRDQMTSYNGQACVYDAMGNPTTYRGHALEWSKVRLLTKFGNNTFRYGANGIRYRKNNVFYTLDGNRILRETNGTDTLTYYYGGSGVVGFNYNGTDYYYRKNLQGDVSEIYTAQGQRVAAYTYDAWGKILKITDECGCDITDPNGYCSCIECPNALHVAHINPFRYRGYYYDSETGLYYLNTRYYDPETGRFINADTTDVLEDAKYDVCGLNLYCYCDNNPVANRDDEGDMSFWKKLAIATAIVVGVAIVAAVLTPLTGGTALCAIASTFAGAAKGAVIGAVSGAISGAVMGGITGAVEGYQEDGWDGVLEGAGRGALKGAVQGAQDGLLSGMVMGGIGGAMNPSFCFVAGTAVLTTLGKKAIEAVQIGDTIPCVDHITGETAEKRVISTSVNKTDKLVELEIGSDTICCTETHPFQVKDKGWVDAAELAPGDVVYTKDWGTAVVRRVTPIELAEPVEVFNFEVEDCHTYFVGDNYVLVHNANCGNAGRSGKQARLREIADDDKVSSALRGEIKRDMNQIARGKRKTIRVPQGCHLAHRTGYSAKNGFSYAHSDLQWIADHMRHHHFFGK